MRPLSPRRLAALLLSVAVFHSAAATANELAPRLDPPAAIAQADVDQPRNTDPVETIVGVLGPLEGKLFAELADGGLKSFTLLQAALIAGGVTDAAELRSYEQKFDTLAAQLRKTVADRGDRQTAEAVFTFLHKRVLTAGYRLDATDLRRGLDDGHFNCVSATVLYNSLAERSGLKVCALETPGHALTRLTLKDKTIDVETTCPRWFKLLDDPQRQAEHLRRVLGGNAARDPRTVRPVTDIELLAIIYYNRGVDLLAAKDFPAAASANAKAVTLDAANRHARANLLATLNNWSIALGAAGRYAEARQVLQFGYAIEPTYGTFAANDLHVCHEWQSALCAAGRFDEALAVLQAAALSHPGEPYLNEARSEVARQAAVARRAASVSPDAGMPTEPETVPAVHRGL